MSFEVAKCEVTACEKYCMCLYGQSKHKSLYDFSKVCENESMYLEYFEGDYRDTKIEEKELITD